MSTVCIVSQVTAVFLSTSKLAGLSIRKEIVLWQQREFLDSSRVLTLFSHQIGLTCITAYSICHLITALKCRVLGVFWPDMSKLNQRVISVGRSLSVWLLTLQLCKINCSYKVRCKVLTTCSSSIYLQNSLLLSEVGARLL